MLKDNRPTIDISIATGVKVATLDGDEFSPGSTLLGLGRGNRRRRRPRGLEQQLL